LNPYFFSWFLIESNKVEIAIKRLASFTLCIISDIIKGKVSLKVEEKLVAKESWFMREKVLFL